MYATSISRVGAYDHKAMLWDCRQQQSVMSVDHGAPIEAVLMFPTAATFITAGALLLGVGELFEQ